MNEPTLCHNGHPSTTFFREGFPWNMGLNFEKFYGCQGGVLRSRKIGIGPMRHDWNASAHHKPYPLVCGVLRSYVVRCTKRKSNPIRIQDAKSQLLRASWCSSSLQTSSTCQVIHLSQIATSGNKRNLRRGQIFSNFTPFYSEMPKKGGFLSHLYLESPLRKIDQGLDEFEGSMLRFQSVSGKVRSGCPKYIQIQYGQTILMVDANIYNT